MTNTTHATWKSSKKPNKQRAYRAHAPLHVRGAFMSSHLSEELRKKYRRRSLRVRKGDTVKVVRGDFRGKVGKVDRVVPAREKVYITGVDVQRRDGSKVLRPLHPSKLIIQELDITDKRRLTWQKTT